MEDRGMDRIFTWVASRTAFAAGKPLTFIVAIGLIAVWAATGPFFAFSDTWQLVVNTSTTIVTFLMVFLIQNSQNRDAAAMQAKLDELIRAVPKGRGQFIRIEHFTDQQIEAIREGLERETAAKASGKTATAGKTVAQLLRRR